MVYDDSGVDRLKPFDDDVNMVVVDILYYRLHSPQQMTMVMNCKHIDADTVGAGADDDGGDDDNDDADKSDGLAVVAGVQLKLSRLPAMYWHLLPLMCIPQKVAQNVLDWRIHLSQHPDLI